MAGLDIYCEVDSAWYDGSLSWDGDRVRVSFTGFGVDEDEWFDKEILYDHEKLITRVRRTSVQLQDSECRDRDFAEKNVCGCLVLGETRKYYDALLKDVRKHPHVFLNGEEECRCRFRLLWKAGPKAGRTTNVGCGDLCFLSPEQPEDHPIIKDLLANPTGADRLKESAKKGQPLTKLKEEKTPPSTFKNRMIKNSDRSPGTDAKMHLINSSPHCSRKKKIPRKDDRADCTTNKQPPFEKKMLQTDMPEEQLADRRQNNGKLLKMLCKDLEGDPQRMDIELVVDISRDMVGGGKLDSVPSNVAAERNSNSAIEETKGISGLCEGRKDRTSAEAKSDSALSEENVPTASKAVSKGLQILKQKENWQSKRSRSANKGNSVSKHPRRPVTPPLANVNKNDKVLSRGRNAPGKGSIDLNGETARKDQTQVQTSPVVLQSRMLLIENMEADVSALDALEILTKETEGICAVHVMPKRDFEPSTIGYAVYKDVRSAETALSHLQCGNLIIVSSGKCRPWMVSIATGGQEPRVFGFALHSAIKSDVEGSSGIISDQAASQGLQILKTKEKAKNREAYKRALRMTEVFEKHKKLRLELCKTIVEDEDDCLQRPGSQPKFCLREWDHEAKQPAIGFTSY